MKTITKEEFNTALDVVLKYKEELEEELSKILKTSSVSITELIPFKPSMSTRLENALINAGDRIVLRDRRGLIHSDDIVIDERYYIGFGKVTGTEFETILKEYSDHEGIDYVVVRRND